MKSGISFIVFMFIATLVIAQSPKEKALEKRAKDMYAALTKNDKAVWEKYIKENYTAALIERRGMPNMLDMWTNVHNDFADSKIVSLTAKPDHFEMILKRNGDGHEVAFRLFGEANAPYQIEKLAIEAGEMEGPGERKKKG